ncbi:unnamed protein product [Dibothriocephalus latus]|uniref:Uncharacterized protein n=1 Tax=Dibothriocephalus latus TaxID=60516 RepID=A0A3P6RCY0_DIBLA|nr:unnamed protein product [Dibothriocephalus latus]
MAGDATTAPRTALVFPRRILLGCTVLAGGLTDVVSCTDASVVFSIGLTLAGRPRVERTGFGEALVSGVDTVFAGVFFATRPRLREARVTLLEGLGCEDNLAGVDNSAVAFTDLNAGLFGDLVVWRDFAALVGRREVVRLWDPDLAGERSLFKRGDFGD